MSFEINKKGKQAKAKARGKSVVNTCNSSVSVLVEFIAVLFRALQKFRVRAAKVFKLIDAIYSHMCFISASGLRRNLALIQSITPGTAH